METTTKQDPYAIGRQLWIDWTAMWNGRAELARKLAAPGFILHLVQPSQHPEEAVTDGPTLEAWVSAHRAKFERLTFRMPVGPFVDVTAGIVAGPWFAEIVGGASKIACGMDTLAFRDGKVTEYWTLSREADALGRWGTALSLPSRSA